MIECWCGSKQLISFCESYCKCLNCNTLVSQVEKLPTAKITNDMEDFYGQRYWHVHQSQELGYPNIFERARLDLPERCLYWLQFLLKYKIPPAKTIELGCAHGGFVALQNFAGFEAQGLELSPWVVEFAKKNFGIEVLTGSFEEQKIPAKTYDIISMMDVFEHLTDLKKTLQLCLNSLKPDGVLIIQTPCYPNLTYEEMQKINHPFLQMLKSDEHLYLLTSDGIKKFFMGLGIKYIVFEPAIFSQYDMFLIVSHCPIKINTEEEIQNYFNSSPQGRILQAFFDLKNKLDSCEADRAARLEVIIKLDNALKAKTEIQDVAYNEAQSKHSNVKISSIIHKLRQYFCRNQSVKI